MLPVEYGEGLADRLRVAVPNGIEASVDLFGAGYVRLAVPPDRVDTIVVSDVARELGVRMDGAAALSETEVPAALRELAVVAACFAVFATYSVLEARYRDVQAGV